MTTPALARKNSLVDVLHDLSQSKVIINLWFSGQAHLGTVESVFDDYILFQPHRSPVATRGFGLSPGPQGPPQAVALSAIASVQVSSNQ